MEWSEVLLVKVCSFHNKKDTSTWLFFIIAVNIIVAINIFIITVIITIIITAIITVIIAAIVSVLLRSTCGNFCSTHGSLRNWTTVLG